MDHDATRLRELIERGYRFARSLIHDPDDAEELLQDAWLSVCRAGGTLDHGYLFAAIRSRYVDRCRRDRRIKFEALDPNGQETDVPEGDSSEALGAAPHYDTALQSALSRLRPAERAVLFLAAVEGYTAKQIADLLEWPRGTVLSMLGRSRVKLQGWLTSECSIKR